MDPYSQQDYQTSYSRPQLHIYPPNSQPNVVPHATPPSFTHPSHQSQNSSAQDSASVVPSGPFSAPPHPLPQHPSQSRSFSSSHSASHSRQSSHNPSQHEQATNDVTISDESAPPHSPISPTQVASSLATMTAFNAPSYLAKPPEPKPIAESDNTDAIALKAALSVLQIQHMTASEDLKQLQKLKEAAMKDPEAFVKELVDRNRSGISGTQKGVNLLTPTVMNLVGALGTESETLKPEETKDHDGDSKMKVDQPTNTEKETKDNVDKDDSDTSDDEERHTGKFPAAPAAQNVYRMPHINWAKYNVVGDALDLLHEEQRRKPTPGLPEGLDSERTEDYAMAAPYAPVIDAARLVRLQLTGGLGSSDHPMVTRRSGKRASR